MKTNIQKIIITAMMFLMAGMGVGFCQGIQPDLWQTTTASSVDRYADWECDTVITRTCGHSVTVSCARVPDAQGEAAIHRFVLRCMNHGNYFTFDLLPETRDTMGTAFYLYEDKTCYYIRDMRVSDSICFFCGTRVIHRRYLSYSLMKSLPDDEFYYKGFFGRFDMSLILRDSNAMHIPIVPGPGLEPPVPVPVTEWFPRVQFTYIDEAATLDKLWVDNGLYVDGFKYAQTVTPYSSTSNPYTDMAMWIDPAFDTASAQAYIIGRWADSVHRSCLIEVTDQLGFVTGNPHYTVRVPKMEEEILTDITGNDCRVILSSRIYNDITVGNTEFLHDYTVGIRYKDKHTNVDDYRKNVHLYSHQESRPDSPLGDEEYGHVCRLKNWHVMSGSGNVVYTNKDFCFIYTCKNPLYDYYKPGRCRTIIQSIDSGMNVNAAFELRYTQPEDYSAGGYLIRDVAYIGNYNMNCVAISYIPDKKYDIFITNPYIEIIDWGYIGLNGHNYLHFQGLFDHSVRVAMTSVTTSLDVFLEGYALLAGGVDHTSRKMDLSTQRRYNVMGTSGDKVCRYASRIYNDTHFPVSHAKYGSPLSNKGENNIVWNYLHPMATKQPVVSTCKMLRSRDSEQAEIGIDVE